jgi:hypothetical protein
VSATARTSSASAPRRTGAAESGGGGAVGGSGLSAGPIAAIALSVAAVVLGILVAAFLVFRRKRRQLRNLPGATARESFHSRKGEGGPKEMTGASGGRKRGVELPAVRYEPEPQELETDKVAISTAPAATHELSSVRRVSWSPAQPELPARNIAVELPAQSRLMDQVETAEQLLARRAQLQQRRERLLQLQQIDEEEERIRQQLAAFHA